MFWVTCGAGLFTSGLRSLFAAQSGNTRNRICQELRSFKLSWLANGVAPAGLLPGQSKPFLARFPARRIGMCEPHLNLHYHFRMILPRPLTDNVRQRRLVLSLEGLYLAQSRFGSITKARGKTWVNMGLTGLEPVTLRLSSACSNQLSYRPGVAASPRNLRMSIADFRFCFVARFARIYLNRQSQIANRK